MLKALITCAGLVLFSSMTLGAESHTTTKTATFAEGAGAATLKGKISGRQDAECRFEARAGQTLHALFAPSRNACGFNLFAPGAPEAAHISTVAGNEFGQALGAAGTYRLQV